MPMRIKSGEHHQKIIHPVITIKPVSMGSIEIFVELDARFLVSHATE